MNERRRFDPALLDRDDPFEIDADNRPHFSKRPGFGVQDVYDVFYGDPLYFEYTGPHHTDWLMVGEVPGRYPPSMGADVLVVPLRKPRHGRSDQARPATIYVASPSLRTRYVRER